MQVGMVGLGKMGLNMLRRLAGDGHDVVAFDINEKARSDARMAGAATVESLEGFRSAMASRRVVWVMLPAGSVTGDTLLALAEVLDKNDIIIDGGNSDHRDSVRRAREITGRGLSFLDVGTSGGVWGLEKGYCLMVGGDNDAFSYAEPLFRSLAPQDGYARVGDVGSGHFTKMIHNGIEYAMMQSYAEGFEIMKEKPDYDLDLAAIAGLWNRGSVVRSWLLELLEGALGKDPDLAAIRGWVEDSGEGRWAVQAAIDEDVPAPLMTLALFERFRSRQDNSFANRVVAALRKEFGGHSTVNR